MDSLACSRSTASSSTGFCIWNSAPAVQQRQLPAWRVGTTDLQNLSLASSSLASQRSSDSRWWKAGFVASVAVAASIHRDQRSKRQARRCGYTARQAAEGFTNVTPQERALARQNTRKAKDMEVTMLEGSLLQIFDQRDEPDIFKMREIMMRLAKLCARPNQTITGDWIIFWASRDGCVDKLFGTGMTKEWYFILQEYLLRFKKLKNRGKVIRYCEAHEILRKVGPFPMQSNCFKGSYKAEGPHQLQITFNDIRTDDDKPIVEKEDGNDKEIVLDIIYSSPKLLIFQSEDDNGECDFYVCTPIDDIIKKRDKLVGADKGDTLFK
eukprot:TRINITY_DN66412_c0_g1_i1.p1 TRINITY_DN66412_c0_g1~~TRINITY_DN66412_c0_g1_i1.p1  ORF type:complete len:337 (+),score=49.33 TRINITY_DN66412_c0_g1_i1:40-1011(+)